MYKLLVVDDEYYVRKRVRNCIEWEQFDFDEILEAADGEEACNMIAGNSIDLIIVDISMPRMNGLDFIQTVKDENRSCGRNDIKMIILTGYDSFRYAQTALNLGVNHFLLKPVDGTRMHEVVEKLMIQIKAEEAMKTQMTTLKELKKDEKLLYLFMNIFQEDSQQNLLYLKDIDQSEMNIEKYLTMVEECLAKMDVTEMERSLNHIFEDMEKNRCVVEILELIIQYIVIKFFVFADKYMQEKEFIDFKASIKEIQINLKKDQSIQHIKKDVKQVFSFIAQKMKEKETVSGEQIKNRAMDYINQHYHNPDLNLKMIADEVFLNANYLSTTFKRYHGNSINEYINMVRLEKARKLLEETDLSIQSVAEKVGFSDQFYFSKKFKKAYACPPLSFRYSRQK